MATNNSNDKSSLDGVLDVLNGKESIKFEVSLDYISMSVLLAGIVAVGTLLIWIGKRIK